LARGILRSVPTFKVRLATDADLATVLDVQQVAFERARGGEPAEDIVAAVEAVQGEEGSFGLVAERGRAILGHVTHQPEPICHASGGTKHGFVGRAGLEPATEGL